MSWASEKRRPISYEEFLKIAVAATQAIDKHRASGDTLRRDAELVRLRGAK